MKLKKNKKFNILKINKKVDYDKDKKKIDNYTAYDGWNIISY